MSSSPPHGPPGADPNFNAAPRLVGTTWALTALGTVFVLLRIYTRAVLVKKTALDDYILIAATVSVPSPPPSGGDNNDALGFDVGDGRARTSLMPLGTGPTDFLSTT